MPIILLDNDSNLDELINAARNLMESDVFSFKKATYLELLKDEFSDYDNRLHFLINEYFNNKSGLENGLMTLIRTAYPLNRESDVLNSLMEDYENVLDIEKEGFESLISRMVSAFPIHSPVMFLAMLQFNASASLTRGITSGLPKTSPLFSMLKNVWKTAIRNIHPYQVGPTNQGSIHCITNLKTLNRFNSLASINMDNRPWHGSPISKKVTIEEGAALSMAAALHDIWKANCNDSSNHHSEGANFIQNNASLLNISCDYKSPVSEIVNTHDGGHDLTVISDIYFPSGKKFRMSELCSLFRLADVLDITCSRVSNVFKKINESHLSDRKKDALLSREQVKKVCLRHPDRDDDKEVTVIYNHRIDELDDSITIENKKLKSITSNFTNSKGVPIDPKDGCNAKEILEDIGIPHNLKLRP